VRIGIIGSVFAVLVIGVALALPGVFLPKRWLDIAPGHDRAAVHAVLGIPDIDFTEMKGFDGWHNSFGVGASVLTVRYDEPRKKVISVKIATAWGTEHLEWTSTYKSRLSEASR
jgi:hypothetical protein